MKEEPRKPVVAVDFDGVLSQYDQWKGLGQFGPVLKGAKEELQKLIDAGWTVTIWTTRGDDLGEALRFLRENEIPYHYANENAPTAPPNLSPRKIIADVYLDDRAIPFNGDWTGMADRILAFQPYYRRAANTLARAEQLMDADLRRLREANAERADAWRNVGLGGLFLDLRKQYLRCRSFMWERMLNRDPIACDPQHPEHARWRIKSIDILRDLRNYALFLQIALEDDLLDVGSDNAHWSERIANAFSDEEVINELAGYKRPMSQSLPEDV